MYTLVGMGFVGDDPNVLYRMSPRKQGGDITGEGVFFISELGEYFVNENGMYFVEAEV